MGKLLLIITLFLYEGCEQKPIETQMTNNSKINVDLLFENEGCKIYRFYDNGYAHYYANCSPGIFGQHLLGKTTIQDTIHTEKEN